MSDKKNKKCMCTQFNEIDPSDDIMILKRNEVVWKHYLAHGPTQPLTGFKKENNRCFRSDW